MEKTIKIFKSIWLYTQKFNLTINTHINYKNVQVGKSYFVRHIPSQGSWHRVKITRITDAGFYWQEGINGNGILTDSYEIKELQPEVKDTWVDIFEKYQLYVSQSCWDPMNLREWLKENYFPPIKVSN